MYGIISLTPSNTTPTILETLGTKRKYWVGRKTDEDAAEDTALFKVGRPDTGENWAEKVACELCNLLELPHAEYDFAKFGEFNGVLTPSFVGKTERLVHGNELLARFKKDGEETRYYKQRHHTVKRAMVVAQKVEPFIAFPNTPIKNGGDLFIGYLMLDAWIANQDRHDENWGVIFTPLSNRGEGGDFKLRLAPTYDHASSLGRNESDESRQRRLGGLDKQSTVATYLAKSRSAFYRQPTDNKRMGTVEAFEEASKLNKEAAMYWLDRLLGIPQVDIQTTLSNVPTHLMSQAAKEFALKMLGLNRSTLENVRKGLK